MATKRVNMNDIGSITIKTDGKYCDTACAYYMERPYMCALTGKKLSTCLGGGPLRTDYCVELENKGEGI